MAVAFVATIPVLVITVPVLSRKTTVQPAGKVNEPKAESVLAARLNVSPVEADPLTTFSVKRVVVPGLVALVTMVPAPVVANGPTPRPAMLEVVFALVLFVKSTILTAMAVRVSVAVAILVGSNFDVAVLDTLYGPPVTPAGSVTFSTTV